jgi:mannose/fructose/N-acetylgalactosamine-specific phosphotransferase system component IID
MYILDASDICDSLAPALRIVGIVVWGIKVVVPIILIVVGMVDLAKAVGEKSEDKIKEAQQKLIKRAIAAVLVFLVVSLVGVIMTVVGDESYEECMTCVNHPWGCSTGNSD